MLGLLMFDLFGGSELNSRKYWGYLTIWSGTLLQRLDVQDDGLCTSVLQSVLQFSCRITLTLTSSIVFLVSALIWA
jgi:hypothetical protein